MNKRKAVWFAVMTLLILFILSGSVLAREWARSSGAPVAGNRDLPTSTAASSPRAFPGAEGFGAVSVGGRGGRVIEVTNLNDAGEGSLRAAVEAEGPRLVTFRTGGTIELASSLEIVNPYITIAGQSAPGGGITLKNSAPNSSSPLIVRTHDVVIRYIRSRPGAAGSDGSNLDALEILGGAYNVIVDHCSFSWAVDETVSTWYDAHDITIQWCVIAEGLNCSIHGEGCHSTGLLLGSSGSGNISVHHNLFAHNHNRNPMVKTTGVVDIVNNVIYNSWGTPIVISDEYGRVRVNVVGNYFRDGPDTEPDKYLVNASSPNGMGVELFAHANITPQRPWDNLDDRAAVFPDARQWLVPARHEAPEIQWTSAFDAYQQVLADGGATLPVRDLVDRQIVNDVNNGTGKIIDDPAHVGGWPTLAAGVAPADRDHDGMPDAWETAAGLNPADPSDGPLDADGDGYTNVEEYLNGTNPND